MSRERYELSHAAADRAEHNSRHGLTEALVSYDRANRQIRDWHSEEINELKVILAAIVAKAGGRMEISDLALENRRGELRHRLASLDFYEDKRFRNLVVEMVREGKPRDELPAIGSIVTTEDWRW